MCLPTFENLIKFSKGTTLTGQFANFPWVPPPDRYRQVVQFLFSFTLNQCSHFCKCCHLCKMLYCFKCKYFHMHCMNPPWVAHNFNLSTTNRHRYSSLMLGLLQTNRPMGSRRKLAKKSDDQPPNLCHSLLYKYITVTSFNLCRSLLYKYITVTSFNLLVLSFCFLLAMPAFLWASVVAFEDFLLESIEPEQNSISR